MVGKLEPEGDVGEADLAQALDRILDVCDLLELLGERGEVELAQLAHQRILVLEVEVNRGRRVLDALGDLAHRHRLVPELGEELAGRVEDPGPKFLAFPLATFRGSQNSPPKLNYVK